jgi:energy-coupling factor transporter ATP-binding protein EcfA2
VQLDSHGDRLHEHTLRDLFELSQVRHWLVVGHPGAGKSTLARRLTRETANRADGPVPLFISLPYWAHNPRLSVVDIAAEVVSGDPTATKAALIRALRMGPAWLLFDGYDEVPTDDGAGRNPRAELSARLRSLAADEAFAGTCIAVFSRPIDLHDISATYQRADLQRLSPPRQKELLAKWLAPDEVESLLEFTRTDGIRLQSELGNPLMLTLLAFVAIGRRREPEPWPHDVGELFGHALKLLMERGHTEGRPALPDPKLTRELAQKLALHLHTTGSDAWTRASLAYFVDRLQLLSAHDEVWSDSKSFLLDLADDRGLFDRHHEDRLWRFRHRAFQERLAAEALKDQPNQALRMVMAAPAQWAEVYAMTLALQDGDPSDGLRKLLAAAGKDVFLRVLPQARLRPARAIALLQDVKDWDGDDLLRLTRVWARSYPAEVVHLAVLSLLPAQMSRSALMLGTPSRKPASRRTVRSSSGVRLTRATYLTFLGLTSQQASC